jgi:hypothetical protein
MVAAPLSEESFLFFPTILLMRERNTELRFFWASEEYGLFCSSIDTLVDTLELLVSGRLSLEEQEVGAVDWDIIEPCMLVDSESIVVSDVDDATASVSSIECGNSMPSLEANRCSSSSCSFSVRVAGIRRTWTRYASSSNNDMMKTDAAISVDDGPFGDIAIAVECLASFGSSMSKTTIYRLEVQHLMIILESIVLARYPTICRWYEKTHAKTVGWYSNRPTVAGGPGQTAVSARLNLCVRGSW